MREITEVYREIYQERYGAAYNQYGEESMIEKFATFCDINTIDDMIKLGKDGVEYGNCETAYDNLYRLAKKCFKGNPKRERFASSTLYYFWQIFAWNEDLMEVKTIKKDGTTVTLIQARRA